MITYEMLAGRHPFRRKVAFAGDDTAAEFVADGAPEGEKLSGAVTALLDTSLSTDPAARRPFPGALCNLQPVLLK